MARIFILSLLMIITTPDFGRLESTTTPKPPFKYQIDDILPLRGKDMVETLRRALDIAVKGPKSVKRARRDDYTDEARRLIRFITQEEISESSSSQNSQSTDPSPEKRPRQESRDDDFCEPSTSWGSGRRTSLETMTKIIELTDNGKSESAIQKKYPWYRRQYLSGFRKCVEEGGSHSMKIEEINRATMKDVNDILDQYLPLKTYMIKAFARGAAARNNAPWFKASRSWLTRFKKKNGLSSRKVTKKISRARIANSDNIEESIRKFRRDYTEAARHFNPRLIINIDQTGINYEESTERVVGRTGARDMYLRVDSLSRNTHSFTAQPILTRDGRLIGNLTLCMQERTPDFGPMVERRVRELESRFGNVRILSSTSGKMSSQLVGNWVENVLAPTIDRELRRIQEVGGVECSEEECSSDIHAKDALLLADSWSGHRRVSTMAANVYQLVIPPHTTDQIQPLDVGFFRQFKIFLRRIAIEAIIQENITSVASREGAINLMSLIYNQLQSPAYHDLWRYAWRHTDSNWTEDEISINPPPNVNSIQFGSRMNHRCEIDDCENNGVVMCSYDGTTMCLEHFISRTHVHEVDTERDRIDVDVDFEPGFEMEDDDEEEAEEEVIRGSEDISDYRGLSFPTSSTPKPPGDEVGPGAGLIPFQIGSIGRKKREVNLRGRRSYFGRRHI